MFNCNSKLFTLAVFLSMATTAMAGTYSRLDREPGNAQMDQAQAAKASYQVKFVQGGYTVNEDYMDNRSQLGKMRFNLIEALRTPGFVLDSIVVVATASPEGSWESNALLSERRGESMTAYIKDYLSFGENIPDIKLLVNTVPENWDALDEAVRNDDSFSADEKAQYFSHYEEPDKDIREKDMRNDTYYARMVRDIYPSLRVVELNFMGHGIRAPKFDNTTQLDTVIVYQKDTITIEKPIVIVQQEPAPLPEPEPEPNKKLILAFRTNILAVPLANFGVEVPIRNSWSVSTDIYYPWIWRDLVHKDCFEFWAMDADVRYWFRGKKDPNPYHRLTGSSVGAYVAIGYYDFQENWSGYQGEYINAGIDYMYSLPAFKGRMRFQFELGIGYIYSPARVYDVFDEGGKLYRRRGTMQYTRWFGPTRAQISVVVPIFSKKGGLNEI